MPMIKETMLKRLLLPKLAAGGGGSATVQETATGNPLTFLTDLAKPLKSLLIPFTPQQEGTGDPSPSNIRSILPLDGLTVYQSGADTSEYTETAIYFPSPVYGGTLDVVSGVLTVEWVLVNSKNATWMSTSYDHVYGASFALPKKQGIDNFVIDEYKTVSSRFNDLVDYDARGNVTNNNVYVKNSSIDSPEGFSETDFNICYELATPQEIQLTPQQITALVGDNTIWSDADGSMTAVYLKKA